MPSLFMQEFKTTALLVLVLFTASFVPLLNFFFLTLDRFCNCILLLQSFLHFSNLIFFVHLYFSVDL